MRIPVFLTAIVFGFSACAVQRAQIAKDAQTSLVGLSKAELIMCAGAPVRADSVGDMEVLTYAGGGDLKGSIAGGGDGGAGGGALSIEHRYCEVSFILENGQVTRINYGGRTGGLLTKGEQCAFVVENCMSAQ
jgi:hypothetical protein